MRASGNSQRAEWDVRHAWIVNKMRPWEDARTARQQFEVKKLTVKDVIEAVEKMKQIPVSGFHYFHTDWVKPYVTEEDCIKFFADNGSVAVIDRQGRLWRRGKQQ